MGKSKSTNTTTQVQQTQLPAAQQGAADTYFNQLMDQYNATGLQRTPYEGDLVANLTPEQLQSQNLATTFATGQGQNYVNRALDTSSYLLNPQNIFDPSRIPGLVDSQSGLIRDVTRNLNENILPQNRTGSILNGAYGDSKAGQNDALAISRTNDALGTTLANQNLQVYLNGLQAMQNALSLAPQTANLGLLPSQVLGAVGQQNQTQNQNEINAEVAKHEFVQNEPLNALQLMQQLVGSAGQYGGTNIAQTEQTQNSSPSLLQSIGAVGSLLTLPGAVNSGTSTPSSGTSTSLQQPQYLPSASPSASSVLPAVSTAMNPKLASLYNVGKSLAPLAQY